MRLYAGTSKNFIKDTTQNQIADKLKYSFFDHFRYNPSNNEVRSWKNSLIRVSTLFQSAGLMDHGVVSREKLKEEYVERGEADTTSQAGYFIALAATQIGMAKNDFLRQIIEYEYPNNVWEKDNYKIREGYEEFVKQLLTDLSN